MRVNCELEAGREGRETKEDDSRTLYDDVVCEKWRETRNAGGVGRGEPDVFTFIVQKISTSRFSLGYYRPWYTTLPKC